MRPGPDSSLTFEAARVSRIVTGIAIAMAALVAVAPPLGYFFINYDSLVRESETQAAVSAELVARHIYGNHELWRYEAHRLEEILTRSNPQGGRIHQRILDLAGEPIIETGPDIGYPAIVGESDIVESGQKVGTVEAKLPLRPTVARTGIVGLVSLLCALAIILTVRMLPLRALRRAFGRLNLSQKELKLARNALDQSGDVVFITDREGRIIYSNSSFANSRDRYPHGVPPERLSTFTGVFDGVRIEEIWQALHRSEAWRGRYSHGGTGHSERIVEAVCSPISSEGGLELHYIYVERDITERARVEAALHDSQRMESLGNLAGGVAHDFNNIITPIMGYADLLLKRAPPDSTDREYLEVIAQSARRARDIVSRILLFSRKSESKHIRWQLEDSVKEAVALLRPSLPSNIVIETQVEEVLTAVSADPSQMHQLLINLCVNAAKAMPQGGVLSIGLEAVRVEAAKCIHGRVLTGEFVRLTVKDTGVGMEPQTLARAFEPFFTTRGPGEGSGIGLATVHAIVERHQGGIAVSSRPGSGTHFDVYLPALKRAEATPAVPAEAEPTPGTGSILVVDDEPHIAALLQDVLQSLGYRVDKAVDPRRALALFKSQPAHYDLVITDRTMPGLSGRDLARELTRVRADIPVILCTGYSDSMNLEEARSVGFCEIVQKPVGAADLGRVVAAVLARQRRRDFAVAES